MPEERLSISSSARVHPDEVARHTFGTQRRGFDPGEVRTFLEHVARELVASADREQDLRRALSEAENRAANPVLDESTLTAALGLETARVLRSAHEAAAELVARAESDASRLRTQAQDEAEQLQRHTEESARDRSAEADAAATELRRRAQEEASARVEGAKLEAEVLVTQTRAECRSMVQEAQELRARVLADLGRRRRVLHSQIEQLRAGRERLAETIGDVRLAVDQITDELFRAEDEARLAAEAAGRQAAHGELSEATTIELTDGAVPGELAAGDEEPGPRPSVDELFARLRAEAGASGAPEVTPDEGSGAVTLLEPGSGELGADDFVESVRIVPAAPTESAPSATSATLAPSGSAGGGGSADASAGSGSAPSASSRRKPAQGRVKPSKPDVPFPAPAGGGEVVAPGATPLSGAPGAEGDTDAEEADGEADGEAESVVDPVVAQRDEVLTPLVSSLGRRLKRALQDDQNDILDRLRAKGGWAPGVLLSEDAHAQRYVEAVTDQLLEAARAGATFAGGKADEAPGVDDVAASMASEIVAPLRRRLEDTGPSVEEGDESALVELVGAAFREWKGARTERLAGDQTVFAFSRAALAAVPEGTVLRWVVDDDVAECPDCDDNALAGPVPSREAFPTGHPHPPAHAGCRCLLVPANA
ncbi:MAG TPA: DivIVA domain-containing protein [Acidimicrobiales bacterium]|nr:DivIVA domain-containing protein [Acidimicrobiales bacterium]